MPIVDKPLIQYIVEEALKKKFKKLYLLLIPENLLVENHFDKSFELEFNNKKSKKNCLLEEIKAILKFNVTIHSIRQGEAKGLGHAICVQGRIL